MNLKLRIFAFIAALLPLMAHAVPFWGAEGWRPPETAPADLKEGEFIWNPAAAELGPILVLVSLERAACLRVPQRRADRRGRP